MIPARRGCRLPTIPKAGTEVDVESLAIDPRNSDVIYAGTWYLPYKSTDGGQSWQIIKNGIIDDSDIFAIDIDPRNRQSHHRFGLQRHLRDARRRRQLAEGAGYSFAIATHARDPAAPVDSGLGICRHHRRLLALGEGRRE